MIYCVRFAASEAHLSGIGFVHVATRDRNRFYAREDDDLTIREPNVNGDRPEIVFVEAFYAAGLAPPIFPRTGATEAGRRQPNRYGGLS